MNTIPSGLEGQAPARTMDGDVLTEASGFIARCQDMVERVRASLIRADNAYRAQRATIVNRYTDDLDRLDQKHEKVIVEHQRLLTKLEELKR